MRRKPRVPGAKVLRMGCSEWVTSRRPSAITACSVAVADPSRRYCCKNWRRHRRKRGATLQGKEDRLLLPTCDLFSGCLLCT